MTISIAQAFNLAYECWKMSLENKESEERAVDMMSKKLGIEHGHCNLVLENRNCRLDRVT